MGRNRCCRYIAGGSVQSTGTSSTANSGRYRGSGQYGHSRRGGGHGAGFIRHPNSCSRRCRGQADRRTRNCTSCRASADDHRQQFDVCPVHP